MSREEALEDAIAALGDWSGGTTETSVVLATIAQLMATGPPPSRPQNQKLVSPTDTHDGFVECAVMDRLKFIPAFEAAIRSYAPEKPAALREVIRQRGGPDEFAVTSTELLDHILAAHEEHRS